MRVEAKWRPGEIVLWLIAAIAASLIVCSRSPGPPAPEAPVPETSAPSGDFDLEFDVVE